MKEGREPHHINVGVGLAPAAQLFLYIGLRLGLAHIVGQLVRRILPVVGQEVVHVYGVPDQERQKADGVLVIGDGFDLDLAGRLVEEPFVGGDDLARRAVNDLPPALGVIQRVDLELLGVEAVHQMNAQLRAARRMAVTDKILLLDLVGVCLRPISLDKLAEIAHVNKYYLSHSFKKEYGSSPIDYMLKRRITEAKALLSSTDYSLIQIAEQLGFGSPAYFSKCFRKVEGISPSGYRCALQQKAAKRSE